jgi:hypothetical protein
MSVYNMLLKVEKIRGSGGLDYTLSAVIRA